MTSRRFHLGLIALAASPALLLLFSAGGRDDVHMLLGRFHPVTLHLPIGMLLLVAWLEVAHLAGWKHGQSDSVLPQFLGTISAVTAMSLGILLMQGEAMEGNLVISHLRWGIATAAGSWISLMFRSWSVCNPQVFPRIAYRVCLLATCLALVVASHRGGSLTHGETWLTEYAPWKSDARARETAAQLAALQQPWEQREVYAHLIAPLLQSRCYACHQTRSFKGGLIMDTHAGLLTGGDTGPAVIAHDPHGSLALQRIELPLADEHHMPPANDPQMTAEEMQVFAWWIRHGAPAHGTLPTLDQAQSLAPVIITVTEGLMAAIASREVSDAHAPSYRSFEEVIALRAASAERMQVLQQTYPGRVRYRNDQTDRITVTSYHRSWRDEDIEALQPVVSQVMELIVPHHRLTVTSAKAINRMSALETLDLRGGHLSEGFLQELHLPRIKILNLFATGVTPGSLEALARLTTLEQLYLGNNDLTVDQVQSLRDRLPHCTIHFETAAFAGFDA